MLEFYLLSDNLDQNNFVDPMFLPHKSVFTSLPGNSFGIYSVCFFLSLCSKLFEGQPIHDGSKRPLCISLDIWWFLGFPRCVLTRLSCLCLGWKFRRRLHLATLSFHLPLRVHCRDQSSIAFPLALPSIFDYVCSFWLFVMWFSICHFGFMSH